MSTAPDIALPGSGPEPLDRLASAGLLSPLDYHFARSLAAFDGARPEVLLSAALASRAVQLGHVCVELRQIAELPSSLPAPIPGLTWHTLEELQAALEASPLCGDGSTATPLVLDARGRLYLQRYALYERSLAQALHARARALQTGDAALGAAIQRLFPDAAPPAGEASHAGMAQHRLAALVVALHRLAVICGGPGTGKTTTVVKILALLQEQALAQGQPPLSVLLLAPTGKAAQRLGSAVTAGLEALDVSSAVKRAIPAEASTLHRALGFRRGGSRPRHDADNPLAADVVLIDEVSMVDLALLHRVVCAVRPQARLILQGDKDQLASVEAGAILGDIYDPAGATQWSAPFVEQVRSMTGDELPAAHASPGLYDCVVHLEHSYRYGAHSGIGRLARAINAGNVDAALGVLGGGRAEDCQWLEEPSHSPAGSAALEALVRGGYAEFVHEADPARKLERFGAYRLLCAHRQGRAGVVQLNAAVESWLEAARLIRRDGVFYENRPVMVTQNDYGTGLFNGDVGVVVKDERGRLRVCFEGADGLRFVPIGRLPPHETVFAMTIHKSQGSEFDAVTVVLPESASPLLGRELLYTAVTRARRRVQLFARRDVIATAIGRRMQRASGLWDALWGTEPTPSLRARPFER